MSPLFHRYAPGHIAFWPRKRLGISISWYPGHRAIYIGSPLLLDFGTRGGKWFLDHHWSKSA